jgi:hypothetical protein
MDLTTQRQIHHRLAIVEPDVGFIDGDEHRLVDRRYPVGRGPTGDDLSRIDEGSRQIRMRRIRQRRRACR